jgi:protein required for attachment to host cells
MGSENAPHDRAATDFAKEIASTLQSARDEHRVTELVLVAEPRFLGMMRGALDAPTAALVRHTVNKDLAHVAVRDLPSHLESALTF